MDRADLKVLSYALIYAALFMLGVVVISVGLGIAFRLFMWAAGL